MNILENTPLDSIMLANYEWPEFKAVHENAINTTIGVMVNPETGGIWRPQSVTSARQQALDQINETKQFGYQPMHGNDDFLFETVKFVFGREADDIFNYQTLGGTGALSLASEVLSHLLPGQKPQLIFDSGWPNHNVIFGNSYELKTYSHIDESGNYNHSELIGLIDEAPQESGLLLQVCGYNGDGVDRSNSEWDEILNAAKSKNLFVVLDAAYLGLVNGIDQDYYAIRAAKDLGVMAFVSVSFSKNMGLYSERLGALMLINAKSNLGQEQAGNLDSVVNKIIRRTVSSVPLLVSAGAAITLQDKVFINELDEARKALNSKRKQLSEILADKFPVVSKGSGLFTKLYRDGFSDEQYQSLRNKGVLCLQNSRINIGGIKFDQVEKLGLALRDL